MGSGQRPAQPVAVVTGAGRGIGRALVTHLVGQGWRVGALGRSVPDLRTLAAESPPGSVLPLVADVTDWVAMDQAFAALTVLWSPPDLVVANAGSYTAVGQTWEADPEQWWDDFTINVRGLHNTLRAALPAMVERGSGRFVAVSSGMGGSPSPWSSAYGASKAAVTHIVGSVAIELRGSGVSIFAVSPGMVRTRMTQWPEGLLVHRPDLARLPDSAYYPISGICELVTDLASGRFDRLSGRFIHVRDDRERMAGST